MDNSESIAIVLCHPEVLAILVPEAERLRSFPDNNETLENMRLVCKAFRVAINRHVTRLSFFNPSDQVSVGV